MNLFVQAMLVVPAIVGTCIAFSAWRRKRAAERENFIRSYVFPHGLLEKLNEKWSYLNDDQRLLIGNGLRQFFLAHAQSGKFVSMPSVAADELWHQFILYTRAYQDFCKNAFGHFMHHTPAVVLGSHHHNNIGLRRTWWHVCRQEKIDPVNPPTLPLLFALDSRLAIPGGFVYQPQCEKLLMASNGTPTYCGGDFSDTSWSGGDGFCDVSSDGDSDGDSGGDSGGDGGGGGCGGGGGD